MFLIYTPLQVLSLVEGSQFFHETRLQFLLSQTPFRILVSISLSICSTKSSSISVFRSSNLTGSMSTENSNEILPSTISVLRNDGWEIDCLFFTIHLPSSNPFLSCIPSSIVLVHPQKLPLLENLLQIPFYL